ncbi:MAG: hypothetical protein ACUVQP_10400 [Bacteroidales bacterium]
MDNYFPDAIGVLDIWHLEREFKMVFGASGMDTYWQEPRKEFFRYAT